MTDDRMENSGNTEHPAVLAWHEVSGLATVPESIETLKDEHGREVWRMFGCGPYGESIIAKRCRRDEAHREWIIYSRILPQLPVSQNSSYGYLELENGHRAWIFVEDLGNDEPYQPEMLEHRQLAGEWLGILQTSVAGIADEDRSDLRDRGPIHFRQYLDDINRNIPRFRSNPALSDNDRTIIDDLLLQCESVGSHWSGVIEFCASMPQGMVHGDFKEPHMFFSGSSGNRELRLIDWNEGGWGTAALDVAKFLGYAVAPDIDSYISVVTKTYSEINHENTYRLAYVGEIFRCLASIKWEVEKLEYPWIEKSMSTLLIYRGWMDEILEAAPWSDDLTLISKRMPKPRSWD